METQKRLLLTEGNPKVRAKHRREVFWQIILPMGVGTLVLLAGLAAIIFSSIQPVTDLGRWRDVSLMWLILPTLFFALILLMILIGFTVAISFLMGVIPRYTHTIQYYIGWVKNKLSQITQVSVEPILRLNTIWAGVRHVYNRVRNKPASSN